MDKQEFLVLINEEGMYLPQTFISRNNEAGQLTASKVKLQNGDKIIKVELVEIK